MSDTNPLKDYVKTFARPWTWGGHKNQLIIDEFDTFFFIRFDFDDDPETPESHGTCNILVVPILADDPLARSILLVQNANKHCIMRFLAAIGINRFSDKVKKAFYESTNPLREIKHDT